MKIEKAIKQKQFDDEHKKAIVNIIYTGNWLSAAHNKALKPYGISVQQYNILRILRGQNGNPISVNALIDRMLDKMSNASRLVEKLRLKGLVERRTCARDKRQVDVLITEDGLTFLDKVKEEITWFPDRCKQIISEEEAQVLNQLLDRFRTEGASSDEDDVTPV